MIQETSRKAYEEIKPKISERHELVLIVLKNVEDATDYEIAKSLNKNDPNFVRPRRYELVNKFKLVGFSQKRKCKITGKTCLAWKIL